jgi:CubicO group peptidase (beta-lactamase class C family)
MNPAMVGVWIFGLALAWQGEWWHAGWWQVKFFLVLGLTLVHHLYARWRKDFANDRNTRPARYYRWWNEVPTLLMIAIVFLAVLKPSFALAQDAPDDHFVPERLARVAPSFQDRIDKGVYPGAVIGIVRDDKVAYLQAVGTQDRAKAVPMKTDSIFWIASMTKPVTAVAAMMLVDEGKLDLEAPVAKYLPELGGMKVDGAPPKRPMQVIDLLRHTAGLTYPEEGDTAAHRAYRQAIFRRDHTIADFVRSLEGLPLVYQPGTVWEYSWAADVTGRLIEVVSGESLDAFFRTRLFEPLGMVDTGFHLPPEKLSRVVDPAPSGRWPLWDITRPTKLFAGGAGLASTAPDFLRFCRMLLNGGELDGRRYLSASTVKRMSSNQLEPGTVFKGNVGQWVGPAWGTGWGLGFEVRTGADYSLRPGAPGSYGWSGIWGTYFWIDPSARLAAVMMIQVDPGTIGPDRDGLRHLAYAALAVPQPLLPTVAAAPAPGFAGRYDFGPSLSARDRWQPTYGGLGVVVDTREGRVVVRDAFEGSAAFKGGVRAGDVITEIDGEAMDGRGLSEVLKRLRGAVGAPVRLRLGHQGQDTPVELTLVRQQIRLPGAQLEVRIDASKLTVEAVGPWSVLDFDRGKPVALDAVSDSEFQFRSGEHTRVRFAGDRVVLNPGPWQIEGVRVR